ncbi:hypothetical protein HYH02_003234 [Chlamydomonas schloesseri]|uniref:Sugar phosphate transporter domain-containing protein n=1 Tax=Chlamydomonas schloesseri TaxID=2026947 RepID=A0A835WQG3_9CHLO|nr:hypothetical protein HYH02_003234 [Chlamydomonas schloesseri]|eukprot:KAG2452203.1 hypothetical protein HYH02_003234 [Chlamydomonas schloesseri]
MSVKAHSLTTEAANKSLVATVKIFALVIAWYGVNIALLIANKWLISETGFRDTTLLTLLHMVTCMLASGALMGAGLVPAKSMSMPLLFKVAILSLSFTVSVAACMASLAYIPASFAQALGASTPVITAVLALLIQGRLEVGRWGGGAVGEADRVTYAALLPVVGGIALASGGEPLFSLLGLGLQLLACTARSLKTVLQAAMLTDDRDKFHPMALLGYTSAISACFLLPLVAAVEPRGLHNMRQLHAESAHFTPLLLVSCLSAFLVNWTNFVISKMLGALTLQVLGNFKNVVAAGASIAVFNNPVTAMGLTGYGITAFGVFLYSHMVRVHPATKVTPVLGLGLTAPPAAASSGGSGLDGGGGGGGAAVAKDVESGGGLAAAAASVTSVRRAKEAMEGSEAGEREPLLSRTGPV